MENKIILEDITVGDCNNLYNAHLWMRNHNVNWYQKISTENQIKYISQLLKARVYMCVVQFKKNIYIS